MTLSAGSRLGPYEIVALLGESLGSYNPGSMASLALAAVLAAAAGSLALFFRAARHTPPLLIPIFVIWILVPFAVLLLAHRRAARWPPEVRSVLHVVMVLLALGSLAAYGYDALWPRTAQRAFIYVIVAPVSCACIGLALAVGALFFRRRGQRG